MLMNNVYDYTSQRMKRTRFVRQLQTVPPKCLSDVIKYDVQTDESEKESEIKVDFFALSEEKIEGNQQKPDEQQPKVDPPNYSDKLKEIITIRSNTSDNTFLKLLYEKEKDAPGIFSIK